MNAQLLEWSDLQYVLAVCRSGTLSGAARSLCVNHSTVYRRIQTIEEKIDARLFDRLKTGYAMTEAGEAMLVACERIENEVFSLSRDLIGKDLQLSGKLRVAVPDALLTKLLLRIFGTFARQYPEIRLELDISSNYLDLSRQEADIAFRATRNAPENLIGRRVCAMRSSIYATPQYLASQSIENLGDHIWLMPDGEIAHLPINGWLAQNHPDAKVSMRCNSLLGLHEATLLHLGVASLPCFLGDADERLLRLSDPIEELTSAIWLLTHPDLKHTARIRVLQTYLVEAFAELTDLIEGNRYKRTGL